MKLTEIRDRVVKQLKKHTIDDYYADSELSFIVEMFKNTKTVKKEIIHMLFNEMLYNLKTDKEIESYLDENDITYGDRDEILYSLEIILLLVKNKPIIPKEWRNILYHIFSKPIPKISGILDFFEKRRNEQDSANLRREEQDLTNIDISTIIALKTASMKNMFVYTEDKRIILALSGGIIALVTFRDKGAIISKFQKKPFEIFINYLNYIYVNDDYENYLENYVQKELSRDELQKIPRERFIFQKLYHQSGYANSDIAIPTPIGYYILTDNHVIEIYFLTAPILFDSNSIVKFAPNISSNAKLDAEAAAEEKRRLDDDDDWVYPGR